MREFRLSRRRVEDPFQSSALQREREREFYLAEDPIRSSSLERKRNGKLPERTKDASLFTNSENETTFSEPQNERKLVGEFLILRNFPLSPSA